MTEDKQIKEKLIKFYNEHRDYYEATNFHPVISYELSENIGKENMWWINLEDFDSMFDDLFELFNITKEDIDKYFGYKLVGTDTLKVWAESKPEDRKL